MTTAALSSPPAGRPDLLRLALVLQLGFVLLNLFESLFTGFFIGSFVPALGAAAVAIGLIIAFRRLDRSRRARRTLIVCEVLLIVGYLVGAGLSLVLAHEPPTMVSTVTQFAVPILIVRAVRCRARQATLVTR